MLPVRLSRRRFIGHAAALAGAAVATPALVPVSALGKDGFVAPSERINMGFVGLGGQGSGHLFGGAWTYLPGGYLARKDVQVLAVCDVRQAKADGAKGRVEKHYADLGAAGSYQGCTAYTDFREIVARADIDAMLFAASYHGQGVMATLAMRGGKDVYCEKPTSITIRWGRAMVEAAKSHGRVFQSGTQQRSEYGGRFRRAIELVRGGAIGKLQRVYSYQRGGGFSPPVPGGKQQSVPEGTNWEVYVGPLPFFPYDGNTGGHRFGWGDINWGQHHYDIVQWGLDADETGPVEVRMEGGTPIFTYVGGVEVHGCPPPGERWQQGGAAFVGTQGTITVHRDVLKSAPEDILKDTKHVAHVYYSDSHSGNFLECVRTRQQTICGVEATHRANSVLLLGGIAGRLNRTLKWDPKREIFADDAEANRLLSLAAREPWRVG